MTLRALDIRELDQNFVARNRKKLQEAGFDVPLSGVNGTFLTDSRMDSEANMRPTSNKYHAERTNGYPSKKHAEYAEELELRKRAGEVWFWLEEVPFILPGRTKTGRKIIHRVDFMVFYDFSLMRYEPWELIEIKGQDLELGRLKRAQTEELYGVHITVI